MSSSELVVLAVLVACACRAPEPSGALEPSAQGPTARAQPNSQAGAQPEMGPASISKPTGPNPAIPSTVLADLPERMPAATPASVAVPEANEGDSLMLKSLARALQETPFSAVVQELRVDVVAARRR